jgi:hypothetical protein
MRYEARVTAYDVLDQVMVSIVLIESSDDPTVSRQVPVRRAVTVQGTGESDPLQWARDALVAILEDL